jgi:hypothetical protein
MNNFWSREKTKDWISSIRHRVEDIDHYLGKTVEWCEAQGIYDDDRVFGLALITVLWVCHMRDEEITQEEIFEILGVKVPEDVVLNDRIFLGPLFEGLELEEILQEVASSM